MTQPQRITLPNRGHCDILGYDLFDRTEDRLFPLLFKPLLKLVVGIKMILDRLFAASCDSMISVMPAAIGSLTTN